MSPPTEFRQRFEALHGIAAEQLARARAAGDTAPQSGRATLTSIETQEVTGVTLASPKGWLLRGPTWAMVLIVAIIAAIVALVRR